MERIQRHKHTGRHSRAPFLHKHQNQNVTWQKEGWALTTPSKNSASSFRTPGTGSAWFLICGGVWGIVCMCACMCLYVCVCSTPINQPTT